MTTPSSSVCVVNYLASAYVVSTTPFVAPLDVTPVEPDRKWRCIELSEEQAKLLAAFEDIWAAQRRSPHLGPSSFLSVVTPPVPPSVILALVSLAAVAGTAVPSHSSTCEWSRSHRPSPGSCAVPIGCGPIWPLVSIPSSFDR